MPVKRHVPMRRCVVCRTSLPKERLIRFVRGDDGAWRLDATGRAPGRGTWVCTPCAQEADPKRLARGFRGRADAVSAQLEKHLEERLEEQHRTRPNPHAPSSGGQHG